MVKTPLMISVSGVRGIVGDSLPPTVALRWAEAFGSLSQPGPVVVGGDSRPSKTMMRAAAFAGLAGAGARIIDVGVVPTPTVGLAVRHHQARGGIAITASHNPIEWNAFKFYGADGLFLSEQDGNKLRERVESSASFAVPATSIGTYEKDDGAIARHLAAVLTISFLQTSELRQRKFRVGLDAVNGAGGELLAKLLQELGCKVIGFHLEPTGQFPRNPEPIPSHLADVCAAMQAAQVDIGFVCDPDADRLAVVLNNGQPAGEELTLVAATDVTLRHVPGSVVANCSTTRALDDVAARYNSAVTRTKVGEAHVSRKMIETGAVIGGEGNGGVMFAPIHPARDAAIGMALILQGLLESGTSASDYFGSFPQYYMLKKRMEFSDLDQLRQALDRVESRLQRGTADRLDGLKWSMAKAWLQVRASNTEPIVRVYAEAQTENEAAALINEAMQALK